MTTNPASPQRQTFLAILLALVLGGGFLLFLVIITGGFFLYLLPILAGVALFGSVHYLLWGRTLSRETADQAGAEGLEDEPEGWDDEPRQDRGRF